MEEEINESAPLKLSIALNRTTAPTSKKSSTNTRESRTA